MIPDILHPQIIHIRHGATDYSDQFPGITSEGIEQIQETARILKPRVEQYQRQGKIRVLSSPALRARGSAHFFLETVGLPNEPVEIAQELRPFDIHKFQDYRAYDTAHSTKTYGQMWVEDPLLQEANPYIEDRTSVETRVHHAIRRLAQQTLQESVEHGPTLALLFAHFETGIPLLHALYPEEGTFPIRRVQAPQYAEAISIHLKSGTVERLTVEARGATVEVLHEPSTRTFRRI